MTCCKRNLCDLPKDLQKLLGHLLSEGPTPQHLETYLPTIRSTTTRLVQDLHTKRREHYQRRRSTSSLYMDLKVDLKRAHTLGSLTTDRRSPMRYSGCDENINKKVQYSREKALCHLEGRVRRGRAIFEGGSPESDETNTKEDGPIKRKFSLRNNISLQNNIHVQGGILSQHDNPPQGDYPPQSDVPPINFVKGPRSADVPASSTSVLVIPNDIQALKRGEKYVCATCGNVCIAPVQVAVDVLLSASLELLDLLEQWPTDHGLYMEIHASYLQMSKAFDVTMEILQARGISTS